MLIQNIAILGSATSGGAAQIIEISERARNNYHFDIFDNDKSTVGKEIFGRKVLCETEIFFSESIYKKYDGVVIAVGGDLNQRHLLMEIANKVKIKLINIIDPSVVFGIDVQIGLGNIIGSGSYFGNNVKIDNNNYILNSVSIQHNTQIGSSNYFSTRTTIGAHCKVTNKIKFEVGEILQSHKFKQ